jgi:hypothetical protein
MLSHDRSHFRFAAASSAGLPSMSENGQITMTIHQVNGDGAGYVNHLSLLLLDTKLGDFAS